MTERILFINVTRRCNVYCQACFLKPENRLADPHRLSPERVAQVLAHPYFSEHDDVKVIFQGGEVALMGAAYLHEMSAEIQRAAPHALQAVVTNLFRLPRWLFDWIDAYQVWPETTFASEGKMAYDGNRDLYVERFLRNLDTMWEAGWPCRVNVDVTRGMYERGVDDFARIMLDSRCRGWDFDASVQFDEFLASPRYGRFGFPILPLSITHAERADYMLGLWQRWGDELKAHGIGSVTYHSFEAGVASQEFNVERELDFITLNPDATVTTNPLYADLEPTYIGDLRRNDFDAVLAHPNRLGRARLERRRLTECGRCPYIQSCAGGTAHLPVFDGSGECGGLYTLWEHFQGAAAESSRIAQEA